MWAVWTRPWVYAGVEPWVAAWSVTVAGAESEPYHDISVNTSVPYLMFLNTLNA